MFLECKNIRNEKSGKQNFRFNLDFGFINNSLTMIFKAAFDLLQAEI